METQIDSIDNINHDGEKFHQEKPRIPAKIQKRISFSNIVEVSNKTDEDIVPIEAEEEPNLIPEAEPTEILPSSTFLDESKPYVETFLSEMRRVLTAELHPSDETNGKESISMKDVKRKFCQIHAKRSMLGQTIGARVDSCRKRREVIEQDGYTELNNLRDSIESLRETVERIPGIHHYSETLDETFKEIFFTVGILHSCIGKIAQENELFGSTKEEERVYEEMMIILGQIEEMRSKAKQERSNLKDIKADLYKMFKSSPSSSGLQLDQLEKLKANEKQKYRRSRSLAQLFPPGLQPLNRDNNNNDTNATQYQKIPEGSFQPAEVNSDLPCEYESPEQYFTSERRGSKPWIEDKVKPMVSFARSMLLGPISTISMAERRTSSSSLPPSSSSSDKLDKLSQDTITIPKSYFIITCFTLLMLIFTTILSFVK